MVISRRRRFSSTPAATPRYLLSELSNFANCTLVETFVKSRSFHVRNTDDFRLQTSLVASQSGQEHLRSKCFIRAPSRQTQCRQFLPRPPLRSSQIPSPFTKNRSKMKCPRHIIPYSL